MKDYTHAFQSLNKGVAGTIDEFCRSQVILIERLATFCSEIRSGQIEEHKN